MFISEKAMQNAQQRSPNPSNPLIPLQQTYYELYMRAYGASSGSRRGFLSNRFFDKHRRVRSGLKYSLFPFLLATAAIVVLIAVNRVRSPPTNIHPAAASAAQYATLSSVMRQQEIELERLRDRNRRLEVLVQVLRGRKPNAKANVQPAPERKR